MNRYSNLATLACCSRCHGAALPGGGLCRSCVREAYADIGVRREILLPRGDADGLTASA
ncbi:MAG: hypothetical protein HYX50_02665 [Chloroflexi bacterium]|nr:hypothetical protein [Chloroflexota bacterium]